MKPTNGRAACEKALLEHKELNTKREIHPGQNAIIGRMLERHLELEHAYDEIHATLRADPTAIFLFFDALLCVADGWNPDEVARSRAERNDLKRVNQKIAKAASDLAALLDDREHLNNHSGFYSDTHYDICQVIEDASAGNGHFNSFVKSPIAALKHRFDMKYWPSLADCIRLIDEDAETPDISPSNSTTAAATTGSRSGASDFFKAFTCRLREEAHPAGSPFPRNLTVTDATLATLASCALDRDGDDLFTAEYVKRWRQTERDAKAKLGVRARA